MPRYIFKVEVTVYKDNDDPTDVFRTEQKSNVTNLDAALANARKLQDAATTAIGDMQKAEHSK